ncbi:MAG TPA: transglycosylase SLT domain-containing protein [Roseiarcus sp.]|nr:transglycosylase SLT domain-containing protein [Roseiarcus sp.]
MTNWRSRALLGASAAAVLIALVPFSGGGVFEREVLSRIARAPAAVSPAVLPPVADGAVETTAQDMAALARRGIDAASRGGAPADPATPFPQIPSEVASSEVQPEAAPQSAPRPQPVLLSPAEQAYRKGDVAALETLAAVAGDPDERLALEWAALRADPHPTFAALEAFAKAHPTWPGLGYLRHREEAELFIHPPSPSAVAEFFAAEPPQSSAGKLAEARAEAAKGRVDEAIRTVRELWRDGNFDGWTESAILREFGVVLLKSDHKYRADRLLYAESYAAALRAAALAGPDEMALAQARTAAAHGPLGPALLNAVPPSLKGDPGLLFARIQEARRSNRAYEAATLLSLAPKDPVSLINPDKWWSERRMVARELLDLNEPKLAFELCDKAALPDDSANKVDLDFHAGWIALRFLGDAPEAAKRFALAAEAAETPLSIARAAYWRGRAAEAMGDEDEAKLDYQSAATEPIAYYGQLAAQRLGAKRLELRAPSAIAEGADRDESVRAAEALYAYGLDDLATALAYEAARNWRDEAQMAAMAEVVKRHADAATQVQFGKIATLRGYAFDAMAFPSSGVPRFLPLAHSADLASVYAVARQESEFVWHAASGAGAKGLMQLLPSTAASTAKRAGVAYDYVRLLVDPAFNTQLGAAFLGQVMEDVGGSRELAFAAYNAGPGRVQQWIAAYGDPRNGADLVDWVERIPFDETRDYVQRVSENLGVYRQRFLEVPPAQASLSPFAARE